MSFILMMGFRFGLTTIYLFAIQYITKIGGKVSVKLIMNENNENTEKCADSLVYKVINGIDRYHVFFRLVLNMELRGLLSLAGVWSVLHADIHWNLLSCPVAS